MVNYHNMQGQNCPKAEFAIHWSLIRNEVDKMWEQAGAELGQAQPQLGIRSI